MPTYRIESIDNESLPYGNQDIAAHTIEDAVLRAIGDTVSVKHNESGWDIIEDDKIIARAFLIL